MRSAKSAYVSATKTIGGFAKSIGLLRYLESKPDSTPCLYIRSLFAIYDAADLAHLDLPWWTFEATEFVDAFLRSRGFKTSVFEYGSGASTLWLARRCGKVYSVEHDLRWAEQTRKLCSAYPNVSVSAVPASPLTPTARCRSGRHGWTNQAFDQYVESIREYAFNFDLIIIDGRARAECLDEAVSKLNRGGLIVFDNSNRQRYRRALDAAGLPKRAFRGLVPSLPFPGETTVLGTIDFQHPLPDPDLEAR